MKTALLLAACALALTPAFADEPAAGRGHLAEMGDPWVPPAARQPALAPPTSGEALRQQVERKLRRQFEAADTEGSGSITAEQARQAGWGYLVNHFEQIDTAHSGRVSFEQVKRYLRLDQAGQ